MQAVLSSKAERAERKAWKKLKVDYRVSRIVQGMLLAFTVIADGIQMLFKMLWFTGILAILSEAVGWFLSALVFLIVCIMLTALQVNVLAGKRMAGKMARFVGTFIIEFLPFINFLPTLTIWTYLTIQQSRTEDRERAAHNATINDRGFQGRRALLRARASASLNRPTRRQSPQSPSVRLQGEETSASRRRRNLLRSPSELVSRSTVHRGTSEQAITDNVSHLPSSANDNMPYTRVVQSTTRSSGSKAA